MKRTLLIPLLLCAAFAAHAEETKCVDVERARCLYIDVPENREAKTSRMLSLKVVIIPAKEARDADPLVILAGGPGQAATSMAEWIAETFADVNATRDLVMVDARGTSERNYLQCDLKGQKGDPAGLFTDLLSGQVVARCREKLSQDFDLAQYTTGNIVDDLEAARKHLGYRKLNLYGTSYGTRVAQEMMRRYPDSVRSAILDGVIPPSFRAPAPYAQDAQQSLERVFAFCREDAACNAAYPDLANDYAAMLRNAEGGVELVVDDTRVKVSRGLFGELFRNGLYAQRLYVQLPKIIHAGARGDFTPFTGLARRAAVSSRHIIVGMFLSVTCAQDIPSLVLPADREAAANTLLGSYRLDTQLAACRLWPRGERDLRATKPLHSDIPTLIISGEVDPVTPPKYGDEVVRTLKHGKHVVVPYSSHSGTTDCVDRLLNEFVKEGSVDALEMGCIAAEPRPKFD